ncbi:MAG: DUF2946 domain-containing protein [Rhodospirillaceae bacterium]|jgi:hypothetical protein|nr:DUF2946 domain-containing protein [Rhodospirillaceae bacterium]MBT5373041.1 DUF2946 domain-containing protein [Rhodospirillaceae bacterium]MBT5659973.1 DUF2946 domain-containing protein [Rhodospirillaceae bacterium]MBT5751833.1 DUF2946 domain-containing protein [Rhodospirillaceae bacterium]
MILKVPLFRFGARLALFGMAISILSGLAATTVKADSAGKTPLTSIAIDKGAVDHGAMDHGNMAGPAGKPDQSNSGPGHAHKKCPDCCVLSFMPGCAVPVAFTLPGATIVRTVELIETFSTPPQGRLKRHNGPRAPPV